MTLTDSLDLIPLAAWASFSLFHFSADYLSSRGTVAKVRQAKGPWAPSALQWGLWFLLQFNTGSRLEASDINLPHAGTPSRHSVCAATGQAADSAKPALSESRRSRPFYRTAHEKNLLELSKVKFWKIPDNKFKWTFFLLLPKNSING